MNSSTLLILVVGVVLLLIVLGVAVVVSRMRLRALPDEAKGRYADAWRGVQGKFIEDPAAAAREADQLAVAILRERGAKIDERQIPSELRRAREAAGGGEGQSETEAVRRAMLGYQAIVEDAIGRSKPKAPENGKQEVA